MNQVSCQHLFRSGGGMHPLHPPVSAPGTVLKNVHVTLLEFLGIPVIIRRLRSISAPPE